MNATTEPTGNTSNTNSKIAWNISKKVVWKMKHFASHSDALHAHHIAQNWEERQKKKTWNAFQFS